MEEKLAQHSEVRGSWRRGENVPRMWEGARGHQRMKPGGWPLSGERAWGLRGWPPSMRAAPLQEGGGHECNPGCWKQGQLQGGR